MKRYISDSIKTDSPNYKKSNSVFQLFLTNTAKARAESAKTISNPGVMTPGVCLGAGVGVGITV